MLPPDAQELAALADAQAARAGTETLVDLDRAADEMLESAAALIAAGRHWHAVYLAGYAAECLLKVAALRAAGAAITAPAFPAYSTHKRLVKTRRPAAAKVPELYHDLRFWLTSLVLHRRERGRPLSPLLDDRLRRAVRGVGRWRWVGMRYRYLRVDRVVAERVYHEVRWLARRRVALWS